MINDIITEKYLDIGVFPLSPIKRKSPSNIVVLNIFKYILKST